MQCNVTQGNCSSCTDANLRAQDFNLLIIQNYRYITLPFTSTWPKEFLAPSTLVFRLHQHIVGLGQI